MTDVDTFRVLLDARIDQTVDPETARRIRELSAANRAALDEHRRLSERYAAEVARRAEQYAPAIEAVFRKIIELDEEART